LNVAWHWTKMSAEQRAAALKDLAGCGPDGKGVPPSGENGVIWLETPEGWRWRGGIYSYDLERGIRIGEPAGAPVAVPALLQTAYVVTPSTPSLAPMVLSSQATRDLLAETRVPMGLAQSPGPAPKAKPRKGRR
jgi:hypothetical protein